jgi:hypothetical protein
MTTSFRDRLLAMLAQHDLGSATYVVVRTGVALRDQTLRQHSEFGVLIDADTGEQIGAVVAGTRDRLELGAALRAVRLDRRYVCVHTHPESASLSILDIALLVQHRPIAAVIAVGSNGTWYAGSLDPAKVCPTLREVFDTYYAAYEGTIEKYVALRASGDLTRRQAARLHSHEIWERAGPALGLRYDRLESGRVP